MATAADVAAEIRSRFADDPGVVKIHKLLYYCQGWHYTWTGEPLFEETIEAWDNGPVVADLWRDERYGPRPTSTTPLTETQLRTVRYVLARYGRLWATELVGDTHAEDPWRDAYANGLGKNSEITLDRLREFFAADAAVDQAWFWDADWQAGEHEADDDVKLGRSTGPMDDDDFAVHLRSVIEAD